MEDSTGRAVFTGDTLFISGMTDLETEELSSSLLSIGVCVSDRIIACLGCGKFFEGNGAEMHEALNNRLGALPDDTVVYVSPETAKLTTIQWMRVD